MKPLPELTAFLEGLPEPHILFDAQYRILAANAAYRRQFSPERSVIGRHCYEVSHHFAVPCDQAGESCPLAQSRLSGQRERVLHLHHTRRGEEYVNIELSPLPGEDGQPAFYVEKMEPLRVAQGQPSAQGLIGRSDAFQRMLALVARVAPSRASKPLVAVDCSSLPESLFESELFGHERGAFTGAATARGGLVEAASGGTLFLDEVGDIPLPMQVKLLRLLETGTYRRVGSTELRHADIRVVAATHRDIDAMVQDGRFREDLYYRLSTFPIRLPPLRERAGDVALLAPALLERVAAPRRLALSPAAQTLLGEQAYPGNVRELRNLLERTALLCDGDVIEAEHVRQAIATGRRPGPARSVSMAASPENGPVEAPADLRSLELAALRETVARHTGSRADLARRLGISERSLYRKLRELGIRTGRD